ncbi:MAG: hypothetical protein GY810_07375 [Aureispira sp.]|nr:hypothetical protein [Aureispira sp.]
MHSYIYIFILSILSSIALTAQDKLAPTAHLYPFEGKYLNLNTLEQEESATLLAETFKTESKYAYRFKALAIDQLAYKGMLFKILEKNGLLMTNMSTQAAGPLPNNEKDQTIYGMNFLLEVEGGVIYIKHLEPEVGFMLYKYDEAGKEVFALQLPHSKYIESGSLKYFSPYLGYFTHTASSLVFSSYSGLKKQTSIVNTKEGTVQNFDFTSIGVLRDEKGDMAIQGFVELDKSNSAIKVTYIDKTFLIQKSFLKDSDHVETLIVDNKLIVASNNRIQSGVQLFAIDLDSKETVWEAKVQQLNGSDKQYFNTLWLSAHEGKILLEGYEKAGKYLQIFDIKTGQQTWTSIK